VRAVFPFVILVAAAAAGRARAADRPDALERYLRAVEAPRALAAEVTRLDEVGAPLAGPGQASVRIAAPNRLSLVIRRGDVAVETIVSDGVTLRQWSEDRYHVEPAPLAVAGIAPALERAENDFWGAAILWMPELVSRLDGLQEEGGEEVDERRTRRLAGNVHRGARSPRVTVWLDEETGLPVRWRHELRGDKPRATTLRFADTSAAPLPPATFRLRPPPARAARPTPRHPEYPVIEAGARAPGFSLAALAGGQTTLADLRGQVVLIEFWAPW
jgi:hypothetical protein